MTATQLTTRLVCESNPGLVYRKGSAAMGIRLSYLTPLLVASAAAAAIVLAPTAMADNTTGPDLATQTCATGSDTICQTPGNVQINDSPGPVQYTPQYPYWEGGFFDGAHRGHRGGHR